MSRAAYQSRPLSTSEGIHSSQVVYKNRARLYLINSGLKTGYLHEKTELLEVKLRVVFAYLVMERLSLAC